MRGSLASHLLLFKAEYVINALDEEENERLPGEKISNPVEQLSVEQMGLLPWIAKEFLEVNFLLAIGTRLLLSDNEPAAYAKPKKSLI